MNIIIHSNVDSLIQLVARNLSFTSVFGESESVEKLIEKVESRKGQISTVSMLGEAKLKKTQPFGKTYKFSTFQIRFGVAYENKASTIEKRESGLEAQAPKGKTWLEFPYWMKSEKTGEILVACSSVKNGNSHATYLDESFNEIPLEELKPFFYAKSEFAPDWYTIGLNKIYRIN